MITVLLHPFMPDATAKLMNALGDGSGEAFALERAHFGTGPGETVVQQLDPLFPKIEAPEAG